MRPGGAGPRVCRPRPVPCGPTPNQGPDHSGPCDERRSKALPPRRPLWKGHSWPAARPKRLPKAEGVALRDRGIPVPRYFVATAHIPYQSLPQRTEAGAQHPGWECQTENRGRGKPLTVRGPIPLTHRSGWTWLNKVPANSLPPPPPIRTIKRIFPVVSAGPWASTRSGTMMIRAHAGVRASDGHPLCPHHHPRATFPGWWGAGHLSLLGSSFQESGCT
mmetsp:Transcript_121564/g.211208  ORF Transcript_121564/g.211208 Transcript_121564/m.211208 type:complete len:219 (-) Transcript_121564:5-661(-)